MIKAKISHQRMGILRPPLPQTHRGNQPAAKGSVKKIWIFSPAGLDRLTADLLFQVLALSRLEHLLENWLTLVWLLLFIGGGGSDTFRGVGSIVILLSPHISGK